MIKDKRLPHLSLIPAAQTRDKMAVSPSDMVLVANQLREEVDYIIIDSPAGIERGFQNAIAPADEVLVVTNPEVSAVRDADRIIGLLEAEEKGPGKLILNRVKPAMVERGDMLSVEDVLDILAIEIIGIIPEDESILVSSNRGSPIAMNGHADEIVGRAFHNIARRLQGEKVPFINLMYKPTLLERLFGWAGGGR
jgi:septum site-determining protein MinD